ncbi:MAG: tRNA (adenosine(37)-N6)-dimethylallyltransferase MiaA [Paracoccaceae bacterium]
MLLPQIAPDQPVLIAGPTASGKSALAVQIARDQGGVVINADASQVFDCWRVLTARPSADEETLVPHRLYGHVPFDATYSTGHWLRDVQPLLDTGLRPIIVGGTGLNFSALTQGLADIPTTPPLIRAQGDTLSLDQLLDPLSASTRSRIDTNNRARVQRAWEVLQATGRSIEAWQDDTPAPLLPIERCAAIVMNSDKDWLQQRIERRFDLMLEQGALDEARDMLDRFDPTLPSCRAIGAPELIAHLRNELTLDEARNRATIATRQYAKRQRTWFRSKMKHWWPVNPAEGGK